jgi:hypothetical protein
MLSRSIHKVLCALNDEIELSPSPDEVRLELSFRDIFYDWHRQVMALETRVEELEVSLAAVEPDIVRPAFGNRPNSVVRDHQSRTKNSTISTVQFRDERPPQFDNKHHGFKRLELVVDNDKGGQS